MTNDEFSLSELDFNEAGQWPVLVKLVSGKSVV